MDSKIFPNNMNSLSVNEGRMVYRRLEEKEGKNIVKIPKIPFLKYTVDEENQEISSIERNEKESINELISYKLESNSINTEMILKNNENSLREKADTQDDDLIYENKKLKLEIKKLNSIIIEERNNLNFTRNQLTLAELKRKNLENEIKAYRKNNSMSDVKIRKPIIDSPKSVVIKNQSKVESLFFKIIRRLDMIRIPLSFNMFTLIIIITILVASFIAIQHVDFIKPKNHKSKIFFE